MFLSPRDGDIESDGPSKWGRGELQPSSRGRAIWGNRHTADVVMRSAAAIKISVMERAFGYMGTRNAQAAFSVIRITAPHLTFAYSCHHGRGKSQPTETNRGMT